MDRDHQAMLNSACALIAMILEHANSDLADANASGKLCRRFVGMLMAERGAARVTVPVDDEYQTLIFFRVIPETILYGRLYK